METLSVQVNDEFQMFRGRGYKTGLGNTNKYLIFGSVYIKSVGVNKLGTYHNLVCSTYLNSIFDFRLCIFRNDLKAVK